MTGIRTFELGNSKLAVLGNIKLALTRACRIEDWWRTKASPLARQPTSATRFHPATLR
jgi:hypothetical protein